MDWRPENLPGGMRMTRRDRFGATEQGPPLLCDAPPRRCPRPAARRHRQGARAIREVRALTLERIYLSPPTVGELEIERIVAALKSGWVAPVGPELAEFERGISDLTGVPHAVALSSATAGLHLALLAAGVGRGDRVYCPTITFGSPFPIMYTGATPVFLDVEEVSWNLDPALLADALAADARAGRPPKAIMLVDAFGRPCDYDSIMDLAHEYGVAVICDAAEALGAVHLGSDGERMAGSYGLAGVYSFNGNKMITTSGGGMLVSTNQALIERALHRATQSRDAMPWLEHSEVGFNYRMSNILAALGNAQLESLPAFIQARRSHTAAYARAFGDLPGVSVVGDPPWGRSNGWLTTVRFDSGVYPGGAERIRIALGAENIESRRIWQPMHRQPVFVDAEAFLTGAADALFAEGLTLPSGPSLTDEQRARVIQAVVAALGAEKRRDRPGVET